MSNRYIGTVDDNFPGNLESVNNDDKSMVKRGSVIELVKNHLVVDASIIEGTSFNKLMVADLYRPISLFDTYLKEISATPIGGMAAGVTTATEDPFTAKRTKEALVYFRALLGIIACGKDKLGYDDTDLATLPNELRPLRELVPELDPIISGKAFTSESTIRSLYWRDGDRKIYFALSSPYTLLAPVFHGMDELCKLNAFPWMHAKKGVLDPADLPELTDDARIDIATFASALFDRISPAAANTRKAALFRAILAGFVSELNGSADDIGKAYYTAACDMVMQENSVFLPQIGGTIYIPQGNSTLRQVTFNGVKKLVDIKSHIEKSPTVKTYVDDMPVEENGRICLKLKAQDNCQVTAANYRYKVEGTKVEVTAEVTVTDNITSDSVMESVTRNGDLDHYFVSPDLVIVSLKAEKSAALLDSSNFVTADEVEYLVVKPVAQALFEKASVSDFSVEGNVASFKVELNLHDGLKISKNYTNIACGNESEMLDMAVWPRMEIPNYSNYYFFSTTRFERMGTEVNVLASANEHNELCPGNIRCNISQDGINFGMFTQHISAFPKKIDLFNEFEGGYQYSGCVKTNACAAQRTNLNTAVTYVVDFGTSNTAIYSMDQNRTVNAFNCNGNLGSIAYTNHHADLINTFFIPFAESTSLESAAMDEKPRQDRLIKPVFKTLLFRKVTAKNSLDMLLDFLVFFNAEYRRNEDVLKMKEDLCNAKDAHWELLSTLKSTEINNARHFLSQLIQMIIVEARLNCYASIDRIEFTYPLSFSESEKNSIKNAARIALGNVNSAGFNLNADNVGVTKDINESKAGIVFSTESARNLDTINDLADVNQTVAMIDIGGGTTDISIAPAHYYGGAAGTAIGDIVTTSVKLGARKMAIHHLLKMIGNGDLFNYILSILGIEKGSAFYKDVDELIKCKGREELFTEHYEFMLGCNTEDGFVFGSKLAMLQEEKILKDEKNEDDADARRKFIRYRSILSLQLLYIAYCIGLLLRKYKTDRVQGLGAMNLKVVLAGNGSRIFDVINDNLKKDLVYRGVYLGLEGKVFEHGIPSTERILYQNANYSTYIKTEVARGALDALNKDTPAQYVVHAGAKFECEVGGESQPHPDEYEDIHISDYFFGRSSIPTNQDAQPMLKELVASYNLSCACNRDYIFGISLEAEGNGGDSGAISVNIGHLQDAAEKNFNLLHKAASEYPDVSAIQKQVADLEKAGGIVSNNVLTGVDVENYERCLRVSPMTYVIEAICDLISF